jgi:hypothetical protein
MIYWAIFIVCVIALLFGIVFLAILMSNEDWNNACNQARQEGRDIPDSDDIEAKAKFMNEYFRGK